MKRKIFNNMVYIAVVAVLITTTLLGMFTYYRYMEQVKSGIKDEAAYLAASLNVKDNQNLNKYKNITVSRITRVDQNGKVIYDSSGKEKSMGNHKNRTEIKEAYEKRARRRYSYVQYIKKTNILLCGTVKRWNHSSNESGNADHHKTNGRYHTDHHVNAGGCDDFINDLVQNVRRIEL